MVASSEWTSSMAVGIVQWDSDHEILLRLIANLEKSVANSQGGMVLRDAVDLLSNYTETHFRSEEKLMKALAYPQLESHRELHDEFRSWFQGERANLIEEPAEWKASDMVEHLIYWWNFHIVTVDRAYSKFFDEHREDVENMLADYQGVDPGATG